MESIEQKIENAKAKAVEALAALKEAQEAAGRGPGGRELSLAYTNVEQGTLWLASAESLVK